MKTGPKWVPFSLSGAPGEIDSLLRSSPFQGALRASKNAVAFCRTGVLIWPRALLIVKRGPDWVPFLLLVARPERFELPTARFVVR